MFTKKSRKKRYFKMLLKSGDQAIWAKEIEIIKEKELLLETKRERGRLSREKESLESSPEHHKRENRDRIKVLTGQVKMSDDFIQSIDKKIQKLFLSIDETRQEMLIIKSELMKL